MKVAVYSDCHVGSMFQAFTAYDFHTQLLQDKKDGLLIVSLGDNIDIKGCKKQETELMMKFFSDVRALYDIDITGNHELVPVTDRIATIGNRVIFLHHGDAAKYGMFDAIVNRNTAYAGSSSIVRFLKYSGSLYRRIVPWTLDDKAMSILRAYHPTGEQWSGHTHPRTLQKNGDVMVFPMGRTVIEL